MSAILSREVYALTNGKKLEALLVNGERSAIVGPITPEAAELFVSYYGEQWKWWALVSGVSGTTWLVRSAKRPQDPPLMVEPKDHPAVVKSSWDSPTPARPHVRTHKRKAKAT
jgi:hypothetical protein